MTKWRVQIVFCSLYLSLTFGAAAQSVEVSPPDPVMQAALETEARVLSLPADAPAGDVVATAQGDYARLLAVLYEQGHFTAEISITLAGREAAEISALRVPSQVRPVRVSIIAGDAFRFGRAEVTPLPEGATPPDSFAPGAIAGTGAIRAAANDGVEAWRRASHAKAQVTGQSLTARHGNTQLDAVLRIDPGPALRFGRLVVPEDSAVRADRLRGIAGLPAGADFDPATINTVRDRLVSTGAFNSVVLSEAETPNPDGTLDIGVEIEDAAPRRIGFGAEIETSDGLSLEGFWMHRNAFGGAERLRFDADISGIGGQTGGIDLALSGSLSIPGFRRADDTLVVFGSLEDLDDPTFETRLAEIGVRRERKIRGRELLIGAGASLRFSKTEDSFGTRYFRYLVLQFDAEQDLRDNPLDPRKGRFDRIEARPFIGLDGGTSGSGLRLTGDFRRYRALNDRTVLAGRLQFGSVLGSTQEDTPPEFLFFSGGGGTVRGQSFQSLGVTRGTNTIGGRGFLGGSVELRRDLTETLGLVGFVDVGYISEGSGFENGDSHAGVGVGLRYKTSLGPIRADIGFPVGGDSDDAFGLFIGIGQAF